MTNHGAAKTQLLQSTQAEAHELQRPAHTSQSIHITVEQMKWETSWAQHPTLLLLLLAGGGGCCCGCLLLPFELQLALQELVYGRHLPLVNAHALGRARLLLCEDELRVGPHVLCHLEGLAILLGVLLNKVLDVG